MWTLGYCGVVDETYLQIQPVGTEDPSNPSPVCLFVEKDHVVFKGLFDDNIIRRINTIHFKLTH